MGMPEDGALAQLPAPRRGGVSVFVRAVLISAVTAGLVAAVLSWQAARQTAKVADHGMERFAAEVTDGLAGGVAAAIRFRKPEDVAERARGLIERHPDKVVQIIAFDAAGEVFLTLPAETAADTTALSALAAGALSAGRGVQGRTAWTRRNWCPARTARPRAALPSTGPMPRLRPISRMRRC